MKAASLELKALDRYSTIGLGLSFPLMSVLTYRGWRLIG